MKLLEAFILGIVQGMTEFIPVSSSGHLVLFRDILGIEESGLAFDVLLHLGTLVAVFTYYWKDIVQLATELFKLIAQIAAYPFVDKKPVIFDKRNPYRILLIMLITATIPTVVIALLFNDLFTKLFESVRVVGYTLLITGVLLWVSNHMLRGKKQAQNITFTDAVTVGLIQGIAITPGISRSGSTIFAGLLRGFNRELATRFSFLLSIPAILGALVLTGKDLLEQGTGSEVLAPVLLGFIASAVSGYLAIRFLVKLLNNKKLHYFSYYCWIVGVLVILYSIFIK